MRLSAATSYRNADFSAAGIADFGNGDRVQVRGQWRAGVFEVSEVVFRPGVAIEELLTVKKLAYNGKQHGMVTGFFCAAADS